MTIIICVCSKYGIAGLGNFKKFAVKILLSAFLHLSEKRKSVPNGMCLFCHLFNAHCGYIGIDIGTGLSLVFVRNFISSFSGKSRKRRTKIDARLFLSLCSSVELPRAMCSRKQFEHRDKGTNSRAMRGCENQSTIGYQATALLHRSDSVLWNLEKLSSVCSFGKVFRSASQTSFARSHSVSASSFFELHLCLRL